MKLFRLLLLAAAVVSLTACGPNLIAKQKAFPEMYEAKPVAILVLPPINQSTAADAKEFYNSTIAEPLTLNGYYVLPLEVVSAVLQAEGYPDSEMLLDAPPQKFKEHFGADAVMFIIINQWDTAYYVVGGNVTVSIAYIIKSTETGDTIWQYKDTLRVDTTGENRVGGIAGLVLQAVETAVKTATTDYVPIASRLNNTALHNIPAGKYHPAFDKDQNVMIRETAVTPKAE